MTLKEIAADTLRVAPTFVAARLTATNPRLSLGAGELANRQTGHPDDHPEE
jgi:hypothetical protein